MDVYRRYFRVTEGPLVAAIKEAMEKNEQARKEYSSILESIGASSKQWYQRDNRLIGIIFDGTPDTKVFRRSKMAGWWPKANCKAGREISARISKVKTVNENEQLSVVGLCGGVPVLITNGRVYSSTLTVIPSSQIVIFVSVPWYDENPEIIEQYKVDRSHGRHISTNLDHLLWEPTVDMIPVKKWEVDKAIDDWNNSVRHQD